MYIQSSHRSNLTGGGHYYYILLLYVILYIILYYYSNIDFEAPLEQLGPRPGGLCLLVWVASSHPRSGHLLK